MGKSFSSSQPSENGVGDFPSIDNIEEENLVKHYYNLNTNHVLLFVSKLNCPIWLPYNIPFISVQWNLEIQFPLGAGDKKVRHKRWSEGENRGACWR